MKMLTQAMVNMNLLKKEVEKSDVANSKIVKDKLEEAKKQIVQNIFVENIITSKMTEKMIDDEYNELIKSLKNKEEVDVSHILIETEPTAETVYKKLKSSKGTNFAEIAKEFSTDEGTKLLEGKLGFIREGQTLPEFEKEAFALKIGEFSKPIKTQLGWHIIKVIEKRPISIPKKDEILAQIKDKLSKVLIEDYIKELNKKADVKILIEVKPKEVLKSESKTEDKNSTNKTEKKDSKSY
jgi:peptidylprolyl isomerase/peptidyl-prolyl cis-trans isomerase C